MIALPATLEKPGLPVLATVAPGAQSVWAATPLPERLAVLQRARHILALRGREIALTATTSLHPLAEVIASEILPLAAAIRFLERRAPALLRRKRLGASGRPVWLGRVAAEIHREPHGLIGIIGPSNYPLLLPGVQIFQALAAGNAVMLKPGQDGTAAARALASLLAEAGLPTGLLTILEESPEAGAALAALPCDKLFFTGSLRTGSRVLAALAPHAVPAVVELSGCDAVFVRADADVALTARALAFGMRLNGSRTCIAPRRVFVQNALLEPLKAALRSGIRPSETAGDALADFLAPMLQEAADAGCEFLSGGLQPGGNVALPCVLSGAAPHLRITREDIFAPVLSLIPVESDGQALAFASQCRFALGASIFSADIEAARHLAARIPAGSVSINDLILPTADPRVPFGGRGHSGFGSTRGAEGLLEMTTLKVIHTRHGRFTPHFDAPHREDEAFFVQCLLAGHAPGFSARLAAAWRAFRNLLTRSKRK